MKVLMIIEIFLIAYRLYRTKYVKNRAKYDFKYAIEYSISKISMIDAILGMLMYLIGMAIIVMIIIKI